MSPESSTLERRWSYQNNSLLSHFLGARVYAAYNHENKRAAPGMDCRSTDSVLVHSDRRVGWMPLLLESGILECQCS